ncbi:hypothetical protein EDB86DRAFT_3077333 [Lactarius hatsudake]|nr:hypothetical protein EDB86DRAFT_3077333 [Lactarius hatsudake]
MSSFHSSSRRSDELPKSPFQTFVDVLRDELRKNRELQENVKQLQGDVENFQDSEAMRKARAAYERARLTSSIKENPRLRAAAEELKKRGVGQRCVQSVTYNVLWATMEQYLRQGMQPDSKVLDIRQLDVSTGPVFVVAVTTQEVLLFRDRKTYQVDLRQSTLCSGDVRCNNIKFDDEWRAILNPEQFRVLRSKGPERAGVGEYEDNQVPGVYLRHPALQE